MINDIRYDQWPANWEHISMTFIQEIEDLRKQIEILKASSIDIEPKFVPPFRVGKKQKRAILDSNGHEVGIFNTDNEAIAQLFCDFLNTKSNIV